MKVEAQTNRLHEALADVDAGKSKLVSMAGKNFMTHAFFPGGNGRYLGAEADILRPFSTLVLGSNFGCTAQYLDDRGMRKCVPDERDNPTWTGILCRLRSAGIDEKQTFFTNAWPFLHEGQSNLGFDERWLKDGMLMASCKRFFEATLRETKPSLIVALGKGPAAFLGSLSPEKLGHWRTCKWKAIDSSCSYAEVRLQNASVVCCAITHPSMRNHKHRCEPYNTQQGEINLLKEARLEAARIATGNTYG